jgi:hypothetical protein
MTEMGQHESQIFMNDAQIRAILAGDTCTERSATQVGRRAGARTRDEGDLALAELFRAREVELEERRGGRDIVNDRRHGGCAHEGKRERKNKRDIAIEAERRCQSAALGPRRTDPQHRACRRAWQLFVVAHF